jgi:hypothetical protein
MVKQKETKGSKKLPVGVQIVSILYYIGAVLCAFFAILCLIGAGFIKTLIPSFGAWGPGVLIFVGVILLLFGVLAFFIGRGLWKAKSWARILAIILGVFVVLYGTYSIVSGFTFGLLIMILIEAAVAVYLLLAKEVKETF